MFTIEPHRRFKLLGIGLLAGLLAATSCGTTEASNDELSQEHEEASEVDEELRDKLPDEIIDSGQVVVATPFNNPPAIMTDETGDPIGIVVDIAEYMESTLGVEFVFTESAFSGVIPGLQSGEYDISMGVIGDTPERQEVLDFVDLMINTSVLLVPDGNPGDITDLESACGESIGVLAGSLQIPQVQQASQACEDDGDGPIQINEYESTPDGQAQVASGRVEAYIAPYLVLNHTANTAGGGDTFDIASETYPDNPWAIALGKNRGEFAEAIQGALSTMVEDGSYLSILEDYDSEDAALSPEQVLINGAGSEAFEQVEE